jgi:hypothetical protein
MDDLGRPVYSHLRIFAGSDLLLHVKAECGAGLRQFAFDAAVYAEHRGMRARPLSERVWPFVQMAVYSVLFLVVCNLFTLALGAILQSPPALAVCAWVVVCNMVWALRETRLPFIALVFANMVLVWYYYYAVPVPVAEVDAKAEWANAVYPLEVLFNVAVVVMALWRFFLEQLTVPWAVLFCLWSMTFSCCDEHETIAKRVRDVFTPVLVLAAVYRVFMLTAINVPG